jgi:opacity protein-like surface antigen
VSFGVAMLGYQALEEMLDYGSMGTATARVSANTEYAVYVEYGTSDMEAQPYLRPAVRQTLRELPQIVDESDDAEDIVNTTANRIADRMRGTVPVDTGQLRDSIRVEEA